MSSKNSNVNIFKSNVFINPPREEWREILVRPSIGSDSEVREKTLEILKAVREEGDTALKRFALAFDNTQLENLVVDKGELLSAYRALNRDLLSAIQQAKENITIFHTAQRQEFLSLETTPGITCMRRSVPIERVGLYVPGGSAPLFSTLLMLGVPAQVAGCAEIVLVSPPPIHPTILGVAKLLNITEVYQVGGAQAVGALAYGTESIQKVDKIFGPGNQYVTCAKQIVSSESIVDPIGIDLLAGPSEVLVIADESANPDFVAADLLSQAEHGGDSQVVLVTLSSEMLEKIKSAIDVQVQKLSRRDIALQALSKSVAVVVERIDKAIELSNCYAPEHLILSLDNAERYIDKITNAGSVFLGHYTPESFGDYASGTNHTLPTGGAARFCSGVSLSSFQKEITFQKASKEGLLQLGSTVIQMAEGETLDAHAEAVRVRVNELLSVEQGKRKCSKEAL